MLLRWLSLLLSVPFAVVVVLFAVHNLQPVTISTFPLPFEVTLPLALLVLAGIAAGFLAGGFLSWLYSARGRFQAMRDRARVSQLEKELAAAQDAAYQAEGREGSASGSRSGDAAPQEKQLMLPPI